MAQTRIHRLCFFVYPAFEEPIVVSQTARDGFGHTLRSTTPAQKQGNHVTRSYRAFGLMLALCITAQTSAQESGFKGFLHRTANAITGQPNPATQSSHQGGANTNLGGGMIPGTLPQGQAVTDGPVYRPHEGGSAFNGVFNGYSIPVAVARGTYPRVALTFEVYGGSEACWTVRARIWASAKDHHDEHFELCDAPVTGKDDLGSSQIYQDPTMDLLSVIQGRRYMSKPTYNVVADRTEGPNPPAIPFALSIGSVSPQFKTQYNAIVARAMVVSGYVSANDASVGNMSMGQTAGAAGQLLWIAGFTPGGNRDEPNR